MIMCIKNILKLLVLFLIGGLLYYLIELLYRGYSNPFMILVGGLCFILMGSINEYFTWQTPLWRQCLISAIMITVVEFISGMIFNVWLGMNIWTYKNLPFNICGQICLYYSVLWMLIAIPAILLDDQLRYKLFNEEKPKYYIL
jgi:uncharacterized membrane protein